MPEPNLPGWQNFDEEIIKPGADRVIFVVLSCEFSFIFRFSGIGDFLLHDILTIVLPLFKRYLYVMRSLSFRLLFGNDDVRRKCRLADVFHLEIVETSLSHSLAYHHWPTVGE